MAGALTPHLTDSNYDEHSEDEDDDDVEKRVACQNLRDIIIGYIGKLFQREVSVKLQKFECDVFKTFFCCCSYTGL